MIALAWSSASGKYKAKIEKSAGNMNKSGNFMAHWFNFLDPLYSSSVLAEPGTEETGPVLAEPGTEELLRSAPANKRAAPQAAIFLRTE